MVRTRGSVHRLPEGNFNFKDLVLDIEAPKSPIPKPSPHTGPNPTIENSESRYQYFRKLLEQEYGPGKIKFKDQDDFMDAEPDQILVYTVYGYYEVQHWPGAKEQLQKSTKLLNRLKGGMESLSDSVSTKTDDEAADETFVEVQPFLHSDAMTIDEHIEDAIYKPTPASARVQRDGSKTQTPDLYDFTPVPNRQKRMSRGAARARKSIDSEKLKNRELDMVPPPPSRQSQGPEMNTTVSHISHATHAQHSHHTGPADFVPPRLNSALTVLQRLDQRLQEDKNRGFISPTTNRYYSRQELSLHPQRINGKRARDENESQHEQEVQHGAGLEVGNTQASHPQVKKLKINHTSNGVKRKHRPAAEDGVRSNDDCHILPNIPTWILHNDPKLDPKEKIFPSPSKVESHMANNLWPTSADVRNQLPSGYQIRVRYIANAHNYLPNTVKSQANRVKHLVCSLEKSMVHRHLTTDEGQQLGVEGARAAVHESILAKMTLHEQKWAELMLRLGVDLQLPESINKGDQMPGVRKRGPYKKRQSKSVTPAPSEDDSLKQSSSGPPHSVKPKFNLEPILADVDSSDKYEAFTTKIHTFMHRQLCYLIETLRLQTTIPEPLRKRGKDSTGGTAPARRQYEANMRLAGMSWQVEFFEGWKRAVERQRNSKIASGGVRFWKYQGRSENEWKALDLLTDVEGPVDEDWTEPRREYTKREIDRILRHRERLNMRWAGAENNTRKTLAYEEEWLRLLTGALERQLDVEDGYSSSSDNEGPVRKVLRLRSEQNSASKVKTSAILPNERQVQSNGQREQQQRLFASDQPAAKYGPRTWNAQHGTFTGNGMQQPLGSSLMPIPNLKDQQVYQQSQFGPRYPPGFGLAFSHQHQFSVEVGDYVFDPELHAIDPQLHAIDHMQQYQRCIQQQQEWPQLIDQGQNNPAMFGVDPFHQGPGRQDYSAHDITTLNWQQQQYPSVDPALTLRSQLREFQQYLQHPEQQHQPYLAQYLGATDYSRLNNTHIAPNNFLPDHQINLPRARMSNESPQISPKTKPMGLELHQTPGGTASVRLSSSSSPGHQMNVNTTSGIAAGGGGVREAEAGADNRDGAPSFPSSPPRRAHPRTALPPTHTQSNYDNQSLLAPAELTAQADHDDVVDDEDNDADYNARPPSPPWVMPQQLSTPVRGFTDVDENGSPRLKAKVHSVRGVNNHPAKNLGIAAAMRDGHTGGVDQTDGMRDVVKENGGMDGVLTDPMSTKPMLKKNVPVLQDQDEGVSLSFDTRPAVMGEGNELVPERTPEPDLNDAEVQPEVNPKANSDSEYDPDLEDPEADPPSNSDSEYEPDLDEPEEDDEIDHEIEPEGNAELNSDLELVSNLIPHQGHIIPRSAAEALPLDLPLSATASFHPTGASTVPPIPPHATSPTTLLPTTQRNYLSPISSTAPTNFQSLPTLPPLRTLPPPTTPSFFSLPGLQPTSETPDQAIARGQGDGWAEISGLWKMN